MTACKFVARGMKVETPVVGMAGGGGGDGRGDTPTGRLTFSLKQKPESSGRRQGGWGRLLRKARQLERLQGRMAG